jgi:diacylglycerol kinase
MVHTRRMKREHRPRLSWIKKFAVAFRGVYLAVRHERSCWVHLAATVGVIVLGVALRISPQEWAIVLLGMGLVWTAELLNTAIERLSEIVQPDQDSRVEALLDIAAGAVLCGTSFTVLVGAVVFLPRLYHLFVASPAG